MLNRIDRVFCRVTDILCIAAMVILIPMAMLVLCGIRPYIVQSGSMEPVIPTGSLCFVNTNADYGTLKVGDIVAYRLETGAAVTHRVAAITAEGIETKGDANEVTDGIRVTEDNLIGKNVFWIPGLGYAAELLGRRSVRILLIACVVSVLCVRKMIRSAVLMHAEERGDAVCEQRAEAERTGRKWLFRTGRKRRKRSTGTEEQNRKCSLPKVTIKEQI